MRHVAEGYAAASNQDAVNDIVSLVLWLCILKMMVGSGFSPRQLISKVKEQQDQREKHVVTLREIAASLTEEYRAPLTKLVNKIERDRFALQGTEIGLWCFGGDQENVGSRGGASNPNGAWRAWLVREIRSRLPHFDRTPHPYATIAQLLTLAGVDGVNNVLVRSTFDSWDRVKG